MDGYKHYIRTNEAGIIVLGFSSAFPEIAEPQEDDIIIMENGPRHFHEVFPEPLLNGYNQYQFKWDGTQIVERTQSELDDEWEARPPQPPSLEQRLEAAEQAMLAMMEAISGV